jgi:negative regulator of flagellin synthesis FlgM
MKINSTNMNQIQYYKNHMKKIENEKPQQQKEDKVEISSQAKDLQIASQLLAEREERIQQLKKQVEDGSYKVQPTLVAEKMLQYFNKN